LIPSELSSMSSEATLAEVHEPQPGPPVSPSHDPEGLPIDQGDITPEPPAGIESPINESQSMQVHGADESESKLTKTCKKNKKLKKKARKAVEVQAPTMFAEVFLIQDLVNAILDHYSNIPTVNLWEPMERRKWLMLSRLSRVFFEAVSRHLWREMTSIIPLFNLLPQSEQDGYVSAILYAPLPAIELY
jgi:hypothetical protein